MSTKGRSRTKRVSITPPPSQARAESAPVLKTDAAPPSSPDTDKSPRSKARPGRAPASRARKSRTPPPPSAAPAKLEARAANTTEVEEAPKAKASTAEALALAAPSPPVEEAPTAARPSARSERAAPAASAHDAHGHGLEEHEHFFASEAPPPSSRQGDAHGLEEEAPDPRVVHKMSAAVQQRRARFAKYVKIAVAVSAVVCIIAVLRFKLEVTPQEASAHGESTALAPLKSVAPAATTHAETKPAETKPVEAPTAAAAETSHAAIVEAPSAAASENPAPSASAAPSAVASAASSAPAAASSEATPTASSAPVEIDVEGAKKAKREARNLLEGSAYKKAIEAGERSVALNPADGDAWYILGSAYMLSNDHENQVRCFTRCLAEKGGSSECAQFGGKRPPK